MLSEGFGSKHEGLYSVYVLHLDRIVAAASSLQAYELGWYDRSGYELLLLRAFRLKYLPTRQTDVFTTKITIFQGNYTAIRSMIFLLC
jgi:hypothetical protein